MTQQNDTFSTLIIAAQDAPLAREIAAAFGPGGANMWTTPLNATGSEVALYQDAAGTIPVTGPDQPVGLIVQTPPTHYISSGYIPAEVVSLAPSTTWTQDEAGQWIATDHYPGDASAVYAYASQAGIECTLQDIEGIFSRSDCSGQEPFVAMNRLGLKIINPEMSV